VLYLVDSIAKGCAQKIKVKEPTNYKQDFKYFLRSIEKEMITIIDFMFQEKDIPIEKFDKVCNFSRNNWFQEHSRYNT
jgi:hypothetical protein